MKKSLAWAGTILMLITSLVSLILSLDTDKKIWRILSLAGLVIYLMALIILILDYFQTRGDK